MQKKRAKDKAVLFLIQKETKLPVYSCQLYLPTVLPNPFPALYFSIAIFVLYQTM